MGRSDLRRFLTETTVRHIVSTKDGEIDADKMQFILSESGACADSQLKEIHDFMIGREDEEGCMCGRTRSKVVREVTAEEAAYFDEHDELPKKEDGMPAVVLCFPEDLPKALEILEGLKPGETVGVQVCYGSVIPTGTDRREFEVPMMITLWGIVGKEDDPPQYGGVTSLKECGHYLEIGMLGDQFAWVPKSAFKTVTGHPDEREVKE